MRRKRRLLESAALLETRKFTMLPLVRTSFPTCSISRVKKIPCTKRDLTEEAVAVVAVASVAAEAEAAELVVTSPVRVADSNNSELMTMPSLLWLESIEEYVNMKKI